MGQCKFSPLQPVLTAQGFTFKLNLDKLVSSSAANFDLCRYMLG